MIGKMSSFRRRRLPFPPQEPDAAAAQSPRSLLQCNAVRIRRGYDKSHLFLLSLSFSVSSRVAVILLRERTQRKGLWKFYLFLSVCPQKKSKIGLLGHVCVSLQLNVRSHRHEFSQRKERTNFPKKVKKRGSSNNRNLPITPHNSFPFPLRGYIYIYIYIYKGRARRKVVFPYLYGKTSFFTRRVLLGKERVELLFFSPSFVFLKPQRGHREGCRRWFFLRASPPRRRRL